MCCGKTKYDRITDELQEVASNYSYMTTVKDYANTIRAYITNTSTASRKSIGDIEDIFIYDFGLQDATFEAVGGIHPDPQPVWGSLDGELFFLKALRLWEDLKTAIENLVQVYVNDDLLDRSDRFVYAIDLLLQLFYANIKIGINLAWTTSEKDEINELDFLNYMVKMERRLKDPSYNYHWDDLTTNMAFEIAKNVDGDLSSWSYLATHNFPGQFSSSTWRGCTTKCVLWSRRRAGFGRIFGRS